MPRKDPDVIHVGLNDRDAAWHDLYRVKISTGERTLLRKNTDKIAGWMFDNAGELRLAVRAADNGDTEILRVDADGFKKIYSCTVFETCGPIRFHKDGKRVYLTTNKGTPDLVALVLFDVATGAEEPVESDPLKRVDFGAARFSDVTDEIAPHDLHGRADAPVLQGQGLRSRLRTAQKQAARQGNRLRIVHARRTRLARGRIRGHRTGRNVSVRPDVEAADASVPWPRETAARAPRGDDSIRYKSSDGLEIPAYLTLPKGVPAKNLPLIVVPHGGPWARDGWGYSGIPQFLANRGYAVLQPNFRGSTGYGKKFLERRQQPVGRQDAGRHHLGRQAPGRRGNRRPEARRHHGRLVRRLRHARRRRVHA